MNELVGALQWSIDQLARVVERRTLERNGGAARQRLPWGYNATNDPAAYRYWVRDELERRRAGAVNNRLPSDGPLISVLVPVYRPELWYFRSCMASVRAQTYRNWELCLCDDASGDTELADLLAELDADPRIKVAANERNRGISHTTNEALAMATGEFVALLDHDDSLDPEALAEVAAAAARHPDVDVLYTDEDKIDADDRPFEPHLKPDWAPDLLLSYPYMGHMVVVRRSILEDIGGFRPEFDGSQDFDVMLRATEKARRVVHVPRVLYHWRAVAGSSAGNVGAKPWAHDASRRVVEDVVARRGIDGTVDTGPFPGAYHVRRRIRGRPRVTLIIPFRDQAALTARCLASLDADPGYDNYELVLVDNDSIEPETMALRDRLSTPAIRLLEYPGTFNWSVVNNLAAAAGGGELLLFMNNDVEALRPGWLHALVELAQRPDIGAVGARLLFPNGVVQHAGVALGVNGIAGHLFEGMPGEEASYFGWDRVVRPYSAVTGACMMTRRDVFESVGGFDEELTVAFNDVDYCMRAVDAGYAVLYTPHAEMTHHESVSRGMSGLLHDSRYFLRKWGRSRIAEDPYYNRNLGLFATWCPLRWFDEPERWEKEIDELMGAAR
ncbi:MAG TPA: glycosyltransferase [Acidimicrobiales bacterium]|nr:glycosyltransferase [Acidimicrobiales bacterium]